MWVCHEPGIEARRLAELNAKARVIEQWAQGLGLEVHFFLIDPERFRAGGHARLSAECSGNAQHYLLLDEFYRSSVVLAGLYPMWWRVPPAEEHRYAECVAGLQAVQPEMPGVDLGGLGEVPREEFAGAALWQLGKVIDAPYKSVLKLLLLEAYAGEYPRPDLLAMRYKAFIYGGAADAEALDPYWLLYRRVEEYLERQADAPRLALARRCLYFKAQEAQRHLPSHVARAWRGRFIAGLSRQWGWSGEDTARLAERDRWGFDRVSAEWRELVNSVEDELPGPGRVRPAARRALVRHGRGDHGPGTAPARRLRTASRQVHPPGSRDPMGKRRRRVVPAPLSGPHRVVGTVAWREPNKSKEFPGGPGQDRRGPRPAHRLGRPQRTLRIPYALVRGRRGGGTAPLRPRDDAGLYRTGARARCREQTRNHRPHRSAEAHERRGDGQGREGTGTKGRGARPVGGRTHALESLPGGAGRVDPGDELGGAAGPAFPR